MDGLISNFLISLAVALASYSIPMLYTLYRMQKGEWTIEQLTVMFNDADSFFTRLAVILAVVTFILLSVL